jgi:hypothetical protein
MCIQPCTVSPALLAGSLPSSLPWGLIFLVIRAPGTSIAAVEAVSTQGKVCILDIDVQAPLPSHPTGLSPPLHQGLPAGSSGGVLTTGATGRGQNL